ncbi:MAG: NAD(P)/FAD-dependent oxidoreductase [Candidatus Bathyarchaeia archaeon]|jgi:geranylgeranyl reductase family protein
MPIPHCSIDVVVVGCGVSGATAARAVAKRNVSVSIFEEHSQVGKPSHCSGHVGIPAFKQFSPEVPKRIIENHIRGAVLNSPGGKLLTLQRSKPVTWVLNRAAYDQYIAELAENSGAVLQLNSRVESYKRLDNGEIQLKVNSGKERDLSCKVLIDASGCGASVSRYAGFSKLGRGIVVNSAQVSVENLVDVDEDFVEVYFGQGFAPGFFGWIIPRRDGTAKVGIAAGARANVRQCFERFVGKHPIVSAKLKHSKQITAPSYHPIPVGGAVNRTYTDNILAVGDAASQVKPTTGGGIVFGLACGQIAGETAAEAVLDREFSASRLEEYEVRWRRMFGFDLRAMSWLRRLLYRLPDRNLDRIFSIAQELGADDILNTTTDIDFQGRTLLSLARDPRLFITLLSASILSFPSLIHT